MFDINNEGHIGDDDVKVTLKEQLFSAPVHSRRFASSQQEQHRCY